MKASVSKMTTLVLLIGIVTGGHGQASHNSIPQERNPFGGQTEREKERDGMSAKVEQQQARSRNSDRQKRLVEDTNRLLSLATDLKSEVDKTDRNMLSVDVIKKADEIERLAHSVKERMKG